MFENERVVSGVFSFKGCSEELLPLLVLYLSGEEFVSRLSVNVRQKIISHLSSFKCGSVPKSSCVKRGPPCSADNVSLVYGADLLTFVQNSLFFS